MKTAFFCIFCLLSIGVWAQTGRVKGVVKTADGQPAAFVNIVIRGTNQGAITETNGSYEIKHAPAGRRALVVSFIGLETKEVVVDVVPDGITQAPDIILAETSSKLDEVIITGSRSYNEDLISPSLRLATPLLEIPQNIQMVSSKALSDQQVISMSDGLIRNVSGVVRSEHWGDLYANLSARGSQLQAFRNGYNVVNSYWGPLTEDMSFVDHIEFVKGPAGFMLSSGDPSGLYNVVTKKPTGMSKGEVTFTTGSFGLFRSSLDLDGTLKRDGKLLYRLNLSAQNKGSFRPNEYNDRYAIAPVLSYQLDDRTKLTLEYNYQRANMSNVGSYYVFAKEGFGVLPAQFTALPGGTPGTVINDHSFFATMQHQLNAVWKVTGQTSHFVYDQVGVSMWPSTVNEDGTYIRNIGVWDAYSQMTMAQVFANGSFTTGRVTHSVLTGVDVGNKKYAADWGQSHDLDTPGQPFDPFQPSLGVPVNGYPEFDRTTPLSERAQRSGGLMDQQYASLYLQDELGFADNRVRLTIAGRYTDLSQSAWGAASDNAEHFTPRLGISGSVTDQLSVYALYDQAFIPQTGVLSNGKKVQPITGNNMEMGVKKDWFGNWSTTFSVYQILKNNELTADPTDPLSGRSVELGQKKAKGIEFDLRGSLAPGLNLVANYAYTDSRVVKVAEGVTYPEEGSLVPGFSKHTFNTWLTYQLPNGPLKGFGVSAGYTFLMDRATYWEAAPNPSKELEDYFKMDAGLFWQKDRVRIAVNVFNVLNDFLYSGSYESWMTDANGNPSPVYSWQAEAPRNFRLSVGYRF